MSIVDEAIKTLSSEKVSLLRERITKLKSEIEGSQDFSSEKYVSDLKELNNLSSTWTKLNRLESEIKSYKEAAAMKDDEYLKDLADAQLVESEENITQLMNELKYINQKVLINDEKKAIFEIRPGVGGIEASLFAEELFRMYLNYIKAKSLSHEVYSITYNLEGGINEATFIVNEPESFGSFRFEGGVHRVQRVPKTEAMGRIHTSTVSVVVVPKFETTDIEINPNEIRIDVYRSSGPGGQSVNTTDSAVRITHLPTGIIVTCQNGKSQHKNKEMAMSVLYSKLQDIEEEKREKEEKALRKQSVDTSDRSSKIRTYNFPQSRITDHRVNKSWFNINEVMEGYLDEIIPEVSLELRKED
jgi:peptide chain release factor 1